MLKGFRQLIFAFSTQLVACGEDAGVFIWTEKMQNGQVEVLPNGIDLSLFQPDPDEKAEMKKQLHLREKHGHRSYWAVP